MQPWLVSGAVIMVMASGQSIAQAEMSVKTEASMTVEYNDNIQLTPQIEQKAVGRYAAAGAEFFFSRPQQEIRVNPALLAQRYTGASYLDDDEYYLDVAAEQELESAQAGLRGNYYQDTIQANDLDSSGLVEVGVRRERAGVKPAWTQELTPVSRIDLGLGYDKVRYSQRTLLDTTVDYDYATASLAYRRELAQDDVLSATLSAVHLEAPEIDNRADHQGIQLDYLSAFEERLFLSASLGIQRSRFEFGSAPRTEDTGTLLGLRLTGEWEYRVVSLGLVQSIEPSGTGTLMQDNNASFSVWSEISPEVAASVGVLLSDRTDLQGIDPSSDRRVGQFQLALKRRLAEHFSVSASYRFVRQRLEQSNAVADSSALLFSFSYAGERATLDD
jgi:hypothetical protein